MIHNFVDTSSAHCKSTVNTIKHPSLVLAGTILASSLAFVDSSVVNVSLPAIAAALRSDASDLQWIVNAYLLPLSALLLLGGAAGDRFGQRRILLVGILVFALASLACAAAFNIGWLLVARFAQGVGAALLMPNSLAVLGQSFSGEAKGRAIGVWAASGAVAAAVGPLLGGWLVDVGSWRGIFLINLPISAAAFGLAWLYFPKDRSDDRENLDIAGATLVTSGLGLFTWALTKGGGGRIAELSFTNLGVLFAGAVLLVGFVLVEKHKAEQALMPLKLFGSPTFIGLSALTLLLYGVLGGMMVIIPFVLIEAAGYSGTGAGAALLPLPIILAIASPFAGKLSARIESRWPLIGGPLLVACGCALVVRIGIQADYWRDVFPAIVTIAIGMSGAVAPLTTAVLSSVDAGHTGSASGLNSAIARTGGLLATALIGFVLAAQGEALIAAFHIAALWGVAACIAASLFAFFLVK